MSAPTKKQLADAIKYLMEQKESNGVPVKRKLTKEEIEFIKKYSNLIK